MSELLPRYDQESYNDRLIEPNEAQERLSAAFGVAYHFREDGSCYPFLIDIADQFAPAHLNDTKGIDVNGEMIKLNGEEFTNLIKNRIGAAIFLRGFEDEVQNLQPENILTVARETFNHRFDSVTRMNQFINTTSRRIIPSEQVPDFMTSLYNQGRNKAKQNRQNSDIHTPYNVDDLITHAAGPWKLPKTTTLRRRLWEANGADYYTWWSSSAPHYSTFHLGDNMHMNYNIKPIYEHSLIGKKLSWMVGKGFEYSDKQGRRDSFPELVIHPEIVSTKKQSISLIPSYRSLLPAINAYLVGQPHEDLARQACQETLEWYESQTKPTNLFLQTLGRLLGK